MYSPHQFLLTMGSILLLGLLVSQIANRTSLPRVTLLLIFGALIGEEGLNIIPRVFTRHFDLIADITLLMVGFLLGGKLTKDFLEESAKEVLWISICAALSTAVVVSLVLTACGVSKEIAIILGCIASATAPAAVMDVVSESGIKSKFSRLLLLIVALDDALALILFGIGMALAKTLNGHGGDTFFLLLALKDIGGAIILGALIGLPAAYLTGRIKQGEPVLSEALGIVFICGGLALWLEVSFLIASMVMGAVIANFAKHHDYPFHAIEGIESLFMVVFFLLAGATFEISSLREIGFIGLVYILCRSTGKYLGVRVGSKISQSDDGIKKWMGPALLPQAGVAIGMALVASNQFPEYRHFILPIVISTTILFEVIGPVLTRMAVQKTQAL